MLNRVLNLARRQVPQAFPPRKRALTATCFGEPPAEGAEPATFVADPRPAGAPLFATPAQPVRTPLDAGRRDPSNGITSAAAEGPGLALDQMRLTIEDDLLMVFGPEGDPVPPQAFAAAAAAHPDARLALPDGTSTPAARVAAVLRAQVLGRLGAAEHAAGWVLAMLRDGARPEDASEAALRAEDMADAAASTGAPEAGAASEGGDRPAAGGHGNAAAGPSDATPAGQQERDALIEWLDHASLGEAAASIDASLAALPPLDLDLDAPVASPDADLDLDFFAGRVAEDPPGGPDQMPAPSGTAELGWEAMPPAECRAAAAATEDGSAPRVADLAPSVPGETAAVADATDAERAGLDPDGVVLVLLRGVPDGARLSAGARDDDGTWSITPLDLATATISLAEGSSAGADAAQGGDLSITGIGFADDGELVAISETVPLADYLEAPATGDCAPVPELAMPAGHAATESRQRAIPLGLDVQAFAGETFDALVFRDLPAGARLSAGAYDPTIDGWVLRPQELGALAILPPPEPCADFTLTVLGFALRKGAGNGARVLARLPVRLA